LGIEIHPPPYRITAAGSQKRRGLPGHLIMNQLRQYFFYLIILVFIVASVTGGWYVWTTFSNVQSELPINTLKLHRNLSSQIQMLSSLNGKLDHVHVDASQANLDDLTVALDAALIARGTLDIEPLVSEHPEFRDIENEINRIIDAVDDLLGDAPPLDISRSAMVHTRLVKVQTRLENRYLAINEKTLLAATKQSRAFGQLRSNTILLLSIIGAAIVIVLGLLMRSSRTNTRLYDARNKLAHQTELLQTTLDSIDQGFAVWNADDRLVLWNSRCLDFWYQPEGIQVGMKRINLFYHLAEKGAFGEGVVQDLAEQQLQRIHETGRNSEEHLNLKDGRQVHLHRFPMPDGATASVYSDITERGKAEQRLKESERQLAAAIDNIFDGFVLVDADDRMVLFNERFKALYPNSRDLIHKGASFQSFLRGGAERGEYPEAIGRVDEWLTERNPKRKGPNTSFDQQLVGDRWAHVSIGRLPDGGSVGIHVDVTPIKEALGTADKANRAKSEFLSSMSHELRTPMNSIIGFGQMLENNTREPLTEIQKKCVGHILKGGRHLLELINEILDLSKVEAGNIELDPEVFCPSDVFSECQELLQELAGQRAITFNRQQESAPWILADRFRFKQVILNLISNAIKYNNESGSVTFGCQDKPDGTVYIFVTDTGDGIPEEQIPELFTPFDRLHHKNSEIEGTGIGLTITKRFVEAMGGSIGCESKVGEGTTFWLKFPCAERPSEFLLQNNTAEGQVAPSEISGTLLYIEDDRHNAALMELIVTRIEGLSMISAPTAELGLELAASELPDLIIMDINLPGMDGYEAIALLKENQKTRDIPVIALSAAAMSHQIKKGQDVGFLHYLTKPINIDEVISVIDDVIQGKAI